MAAERSKHVYGKVSLPSSSSSPCLFFKKKCGPISESEQGASQCFILNDKIV